jgi:ATP-dependent Lon protease
MKESSTIAQTYAKNFLDTHFKDHDLKPIEKLETQDLHIHFPEGAVPKDGPSAGVAITTALVGLALGEPTIRHVGMTGEISLNGKVLPIGGVKEKIMAAKREGLKTLILPSGNSKDVKKLPDNITDGIEFHFVSTFEDAFKVIYPGFKLNN